MFENFWKAMFLMTGGNQTKDGILTQIQELTKIGFVSNYTTLNSIQTHPTPHHSIPSHLTTLRAILFHSIALHSFHFIPCTNVHYIQSSTILDSIQLTILIPIFIPIFLSTILISLLTPTPTPIPIHFYFRQFRSTFTSHQSKYVSICNSPGGDHQ